MIGNKKAIGRAAGALKQLDELPPDELVKSILIELEVPHLDIDQPGASSLEDQYII